MPEEKDPLDLDLGIFSKPVNAVRHLGEVVDDALPGSATTMFVAMGIGVGLGLGGLIALTARKKK